jgi:hypothetical protein
MARKECFGSIREVESGDHMTITQATFGCRDCLEFRKCLQFARERDEIKKQNMIAKMIDLSEVHSNEIGACLLECMSRIYSSPLGSALFKNLFMFFEVPRDVSSFSFTIPISSPIMSLMADGEETPFKGFTVRVVMIQRIFPGQRKANMGLIAQEVARALSSDDRGANEILQMLSETEGTKFRKMDAKLQAGWLIQRWGFQEEYEAFQREIQKKVGLG